MKLKAALPIKAHAYDGQMTLFYTYGKKYRLNTERMFATMCHTGGEHTFEISDISY